MNILLDGNQTGNLIVIIVLLVACAVMFILSYFKNKKYMANQQNLLDEIKVGSKVLTKTFIYGTVESITETTDGKIVLIKTGEGDKVSYLEMNLEAIYSIDNKEEVVDLDDVMTEEKDEKVDDKILNKKEELEEVKTDADELEELKPVEVKPKKTTKKTNKK